MEPKQKCGLKFFNIWMNLCVCVCVPCVCVCAQFPHKASWHLFWGTQRFLASVDMSVWLCLCQLDKYKQYNHPGTRACVQVLPRPSGLLYLHHWLLRWDKAHSAGLGCLCSPTSAVNLRQAVILLTATCQSTSTSEIHTDIPSFSVSLWPGLGFCLSDQLHTSELLSVSFLHKRMHNSLK